MTISTQQLISKLQEIIFSHQLLPTNLFRFWSLCFNINDVQQINDNWRLLQTLYSAPCVFFFLYIWMAPESVRWLISKGRTREAHAIITRTAQINKVPPTNNCLFFFIFVLFKKSLQFLQRIYVRNVHPVYGAGIRTHNVQNTSLLP